MTEETNETKKKRPLWRTGLEVVIALGIIGGLWQIAVVCVDNQLSMDREQAQHERTQQAKLHDKHIEIRTKVFALFTAKIQTIWNIYRALENGRAATRSRDRDAVISFQRDAQQYRDQFQQKVIESNELLEGMKVYFPKEPQLIQDYIEIGIILHHIARDIERLSEADINKRLASVDEPTKRLQDRFNELLIGDTILHPGSSNESPYTGLNSGTTDVLKTPPTDRIPYASPGVGYILPPQRTNGDSSTESNTQP